MASKLKLFTCKDTRMDCRNRTMEGKCRILCNTDFTDKDGTARLCTFYKQKIGDSEEVI